MKLQKGRSWWNVLVGWALVNFLTTTKPGHVFLNKILNELRGGKRLQRGDRLRITRNKRTLESLQAAWYADIESRIIPGVSRRQ